MVDDITFDNAAVDNVIRDNGAAERIASVMRDLAALEAMDEVTNLPPRSRRQSGPSVVFSLRLDRDELRALERRAAQLDIKPTVRQDYGAAGATGGR